MISLLSEADHYTNSYGKFRLYVFSEYKVTDRHVVLVKGDVSGKSNVLCRLQSHCLPGITLDSSDCDCKSQLDYSLDHISKSEFGLIVYLDQEGRGHGLHTKIEALNFKNKGLDTFQAVDALGLDADVRDYACVKEILDYFQVESVRLMTNNPSKVCDLEGLGIDISSVERVKSIVTDRNERHLRAKVAKGHTIAIKRG